MDTKTLYRADGLGGWMLLVEAPTARQALAEAKRRASSASLLPTDITTVRRATAEDVAWYQSMGGVT